MVVKSIPTMDYAEIDAPVGASGTVSSENDFSDITFSTLNYTISSTLRPSHSSPKEYQFDGSSVVVILYFIIVQASIWAFFIFCYFTRRGRSPAMRSSVESNPPSASADMPPDYASSVNPTDYPPFIEIVLDEKPPDYDKVIAAAAAATPSTVPAKR